MHLNIIWYFTYTHVNPKWECCTHDSDGSLNSQISMVIYMYTRNWYRVCRGWNCNCKISIYLCDVTMRAFERIRIGFVCFNSLILYLIIHPTEQERSKVCVLQVMCVFRAAHISTPKNLCTTWPSVNGACSVLDHVHQVPFNDILQQQPFLFLSAILTHQYIDVYKTADQM